MKLGRRRRKQKEGASAYAQGVAHWRAREFEAAASSFARVAEFDRPSALFKKRAGELASSPPDRGWDPISSLDSK